ncbi:PREDICTED: major centromere autoantigen B [Chrysochloris asiatica]|uniref:Major centromere autoantigen B n=1 Tax=Chrysochloris asiatica TaxID=185453 RepID=A0A9B0U8F7_CHRAS|nr:PREDICTED: major centromere autoantigen B [Chrysochloris asiatica]
MGEEEGAGQERSRSVRSAPLTALLEPRAAPLPAFGARPPALACCPSPPAGAAVAGAPGGRQLTFREKSRIIQEVEENPDLRKGEIARRFNIPPSTLSTILKNKRAILASERKYGVASTCRKTNKLSPYDKLEGLLIAWFQQIRAAGLPVKGIILKEKALRIAEELGMDDFTASNGWLDRFRRRHGVMSCSGVPRPRARNSAPRRPAAPASATTVPSEGSGGGSGRHTWEEQQPSVVEGYASQDVFSAIETSLWYDFLPDQAAGLCGSDGRERRATQRLSVLLCANADGSEKLPPLVAGKSAKPRAGQGGLPCDYTANSKGGVTSQVLAKYLKALDARMATESRRVLLLAGRMAAQSLDTSGLRHVQLAFFPSGTVQPLERGVIQQVKGHYRQAMLLKAMAALESQDPSRLQLGLIEALHFVAAAWQAVQPSDIATCFRESGFGGDPDATITTALKSEGEEEEEEEEEDDDDEEEEGGEEGEDGEGEEEGEEEEGGEGEELGEEEEVEEEGEVDDSDEEEDEEESSSEGLDAEDWAQGVVEAGGSFGGYGAQEEAQCPTFHFLEGEEDSESDSEDEEEDEDDEDEDEEDEEDGDEVPVPSFGEAMAYFAMVKRYLTSFPIDDRVQSHILHLEHDLVHVTKKNHARQVGVWGFGHQS